MTITGYSFTPLGQFMLAEVTSDLGSPTFFWYLDGVFYARTEAPEITVYLSGDDQAELVAVDTENPDTFDIIANAPTLYPARRTLWWVRSTDSDVARYIIRQQREAEGYLEIGEAPATDQWSYRFITPRLDDLTNYDWQIVPVDEAGNEGTALSLPQEFIVRSPDAPNFTITYTAGTMRVQFNAA